MASPCLVCFCEIIACLHFVLICILNGCPGKSRLDQTIPWYHCWSALPNTVLQCRTLYCLWLHCNVLDFIQPTHNTHPDLLISTQTYTSPPNSTLLHYTKHHYCALHCTVLSCTKLHCTTLHCTALHCNTLHFTVLHCTTLHATPLHFTLSDLLKPGSSFMSIFYPGFSYVLTSPYINRWISFTYLGTSYLISSYSIDLCYPVGVLSCIVW